MNQTSEILKNEDGLTIVRLSPRKLMFKYDIPLCLSNGEQVSMIENRDRFRFNDNGEYTLIDNNIKLIRKLSNQFGLKMCHFAFIKSPQIHFGKKFIMVDYILVVNNKPFERNYKLNKIL